MGLSIEVGIIADLLKHDEEGAGHFQEEFATLSRYLTSVHLKAHIDPPEVDVWSGDMYGYSGLHYLRRIASHLHYSGRLPEPGDENAGEDPTLKRYYSDFDQSDARSAFGTFDH
jgi:hypothetical protein